MKNCKLFILTASILMLASCGRVVAYSEFTQQNTAEIINDTEYDCKILWADREVCAGDDAVVISEQLITAGEKYTQQFVSGERSFSKDGREMIIWSPDVTVLFFKDKAPTLKYTYHTDNDYAPENAIWSQLPKYKTTSSYDSRNGHTEVNEWFYLSDILELSKVEQDSNL